MTELKPAYLIHGADHGRVAERRASLRRLAEARGGASGLELFEGDAATPEAVARALSAMTFAVGWRFIIVDGTERWRDADVQSTLAGALREMAPETTVAFFAREEGRQKVPPKLRDAVHAAGGEVAEEATVKPWELPSWVRTQAAGLGLALDNAAARALVAQVGERQQRLLRELEKLVLERDADSGPLTAEDIEERAAHSSQSRVFSLADALVAQDGAAAVGLYLRLRAQGERLPGLMYWMAQRVREANDVARRLEAGESPAQIKRGLRMPPRVAERFVADVRRSEPLRLRAALETLAELEVDSRGGPPLPGAGPRRGALDEDTQAVRAIAAITG